MAGAEGNPQREPEAPRGSAPRRIKTPERRHVARLPVPGQLSGRGMGQLQVRLLDLSLDGARIEHIRRLADRALCFLDLPPALGGIGLQGEAIWTQVVGRQAVAEGKWEVIFQSGLRFTMLTPEQQAGLAEALRILTAAQES